jgi:hypothetical protein
MSFKYRIAVLTAGALLAGAPAALASGGGGTGNASTTGTTSTTAGGASGGNPSGGGSGGTAPSGGGGGGNGGSTSGNNNNAPPNVCTIASFTNTPGIDQANGSADITTALVIPAGCPGHSQYTITYTNALSGQVVWSEFGFPGQVASGNANAVTPGTSTSFEVSTLLQFATPYNVSMTIETSLGAVLATANQSVVTPAQS